MFLYFKKLSENAIQPTRADEGAAGFDLYAAEDAVIKPLERKLIKTNIGIEIPKGYYGRIAPRSGLAYKNGIDVFAGVIDSSYRGDVGVILFNSDVIVWRLTDPECAKKTLAIKDHLGKTFEVKKGDRIAQLIIEQCFYPKFMEVLELEDSTRGTGGYGSSGK